MTAAIHGVEVRLERTIHAPRHQVYRAWLDPELLRKWLAPGSTEVSRVELDERVGGHFRIWHANAGQHVGGFECQFVELVPGERIVFQWGFVGPQRADGPMFDSLLTITFHDASGDATRLTLLHERLNDLERAMPQVARNVGVGWEMVFAKLAEMFNRERA